MPQICVSIIEETTTGVIDAMADLEGVADLFEIRADRILDLDILTLLRAKTKPLIFTCRPTSEGGRFSDGEERRRLLLLEAVKRGYDYVDIEYRSNLLDVMIEKSGSGLIVSYHDLEGTPQDLDGLYAGMFERGADIVKIVVTPHSIADVGRLLAFAARVQQRAQAPLIAIALGPLGPMTRILAGRYDAPFTYASAATGAEAGPGQLPAGVLADVYRVRDVTSETKVYGIVGTNAVHSLSPYLHNRAFAARGLDAVYVPIQAESLDAFFEALPALGLSGFSVTRPFKTAIVPRLAEVDELAALAGSVNTVSLRDSVWCGSTTDGIGVTAPLKKKIDVKGKSVVVVGAGGAARTAAVVLHRKGAQVTVLARDAAKAAALAQSVGCGHGDLATVRNYTWDVLVNATPLGSHEAPDETPVPAGLLRPGAIVFDMVYDPIDTRLLREAQRAGCVTIDGLQMLLAQAAPQFETWTGLEAPADVLKSAAVLLAQEQE